MPPVEVGRGERQESVSPGEGAEGKAERSLLKVVWVDTLFPKTPESRCFLGDWGRRRTSLFS